MKTQLTIEQSEQIRKALELSPEAFSVRLDYSPLAYRNALKRGQLSRWMAQEIRRRFWRHVGEA